MLRILDELTCKLKKLNHSEIFDDLNLIAKLLQKSQKKEKSLKINKKPPLIEVLSRQENEEESNKENFSEGEKKAYPNEEYKYGFNDQFFDFFKDLQVFFLEMYLNFHCYLGRTF